MCAALSSYDTVSFCQLLMICNPCNMATAMSLVTGQIR